eukprot:TRINITY_DN60936_c0_g1_i1.p1 TRINITY_DN60936_c0_g1~~TRINITY_DN60936_c0_g1_i1.p1  ORF type:complete len:492 (-),score=46.46 TRINITY_DN60936_c0_g1_i1:13-1419(-)
MVHQVLARTEKCDGASGAEVCKADATSTTPRVCGAWCEGPEVADETPCSMDQTRMPCSGEWCTSTCQMWTSFMIKDLQTFNVSCENFANFYGFPRGAEVCKPECVLPEIGVDRYPAPTGLGLLCRPGSCEPSTQSRYANDHMNKFSGLGVLSCPCNWFGSDCQSDWVPIQAIEKEVSGDLHMIRFRVDNDDWQKIMANHKPGGVVRVQHLDASGVAREQPYALLTDNDGTIGVLEVLAGTPQAGMHPSVVEVAERVRAHPGGAVSGLYINPSVAGFFNKRWTFLMDALAQSSSLVSHVVVVSAGSGLSGASSAISRILSSGLAPLPRLHLYHGIRHVRHLPYRQQLKAWEEGGMELTLVTSNKANEQDEMFNRALERGAQLSTRVFEEQTPVSQFLTRSTKAYVQHAFGMDLAIGSLRQGGASPRNMVVVICGRVELLQEMPLILAALCNEYGPECEDFLMGRIFTNI